GRRVFLTTRAPGVVTTTMTSTFQSNHFCRSGRPSLRFLLLQRLLPPAATVAVVARLRIEASPGANRPLLFVDNVRLGVSQKLARFKKLVEVGDQPNFVAGDAPHDVPRLDFTGMVDPRGADQLGQCMKRIAVKIANARRLVLWHKRALPA